MLTATQLHITEEERQALILTRDVLQAEQVVFDMGNQCSVRTDNERERESLPPCRTNLCIGGTMKLLMLNNMQLPEIVTPEMGDEIVKYVDKQEDIHHPLFDLFWGNTSSETTPAEGIRAIDRFLVGDYPWP